MSLYDSILIPGGSGMLAQALVRALKSRGKTAVAPAHRDLDITDEKGVRSLFANTRPSLVINCAAYTKVDKCEEEPEQATAVNAHAIETLANLCREYRSTLVHFSTDFVFDGTKREPYTRDDAPNPQSAYGRSKLLGEKLAGPDALIIRTAWLYGPGGPCFPRTMVDLARQKKPLSVVEDQIGSPTFTKDLAEATLHLLDQTTKGLYHITNVGSVSWFNFTKAILEEFDEHAPVSPITSAQWKQKRPSSATRPAYSVLDVSAYESLTGHRMRPWRQALRDYRLAVAEGGF